MADLNSDGGGEPFKCRDVISVEPVPTIQPVSSAKPVCSLGTSVKKVPKQLMDVNYVSFDQPVSYVQPVSSAWPGPPSGLSPPSARLARRSPTCSSTST